MELNDREKLLRKIQSTGLAMFDASLFLDSHPNDQDALHYFRNHKMMNEAAEKEYTSKYGPLSRGQVSAGESTWTWIQNPWPWEYEEGK